MANEWNYSYGIRRARVDFAPSFALTPGVLKVYSWCTTLPINGPLTASIGGWKKSKRSATVQDFIHSFNSSQKYPNVMKLYSTHPAYQKYWLAIVCTWLSRGKWVNEMRRLTQLRIEWRSSKFRLSAISISARASRSSLGWHYTGTAWRDYGDPIKVSTSDLSKFL